MKKVICTNPEPCPQCTPNPPAQEPLVRGRAYTVLDEFKQGRFHGYQLAEIPLPFGWWSCAPHFQEIEKADTAIFKLTDAPVKVLEDVQ